MCDQSAEMPWGDSGPDGEEPTLSPATGEGAGEQSVTSGQQDRGAQGRGEESGASGGEVRQEDEEMTSGSHDLSSLANHSPESATGLAAKSQCLNGEYADGERGQAHREVKITVAEMKKRLPSGKRSRSKSAQT